jgi:predicted RNA binding protein YcfA (HicA-like mRNA interferase family)
VGYSTRRLSELLQRLGYCEDPGSGKGSHLRLYFDYGGKRRRATTLPQGREEISEGLLQAVLRQTGLTKQDLAEIKAKRLGKEEYLRRLGLD